MTRCQTPWLMTDERLGDALFEAIARVPRGGGVVFRHDRAPDREALAQQVAMACRANGLALAVAGDAALAKAVGASFVHRPTGEPEMPFTLPVHDEREARAAAERGAALAFVSPVFPTQSHPGAPSLGVEEATRLARLCGCPAIALGGMNAARFASLGDAFSGWAGIGAFSS